MSFTKSFLTYAEFAFDHVVKKSVCAMLALVSALWIILPDSWMQQYFTIWAYLIMLGCIMTGGYLFYVAHPVDNPAHVGRRLSFLMFVFGVTGVSWMSFGLTGSGGLWCIAVSAAAVITWLMINFRFVREGGVDEPGCWEMRLLIVGALNAILQAISYFVLIDQVATWGTLARLCVIAFAVLSWFVWTPLFQHANSTIRSQAHA